YAFEHGKLTNLLFGMDDVNVDAGKLAMWRLRTRGQFGGKWLSDYRVNTLGMASGEPLPQEQGRAKPEAPIIGADANVFNIIGIAARALRRAGMPEQAKEMSAKAMQSGSYDEALGVIMEYVEPADVEYAGHGMMMEMGEI
ncbi:MAG: hypothetical protein LBQ16_02765, partial [Gracilibacteraceae bacterium]|nr:hypothetical protein [Gracilibacteraceae bacterium]